MTTNIFWAVHPNEYMDHEVREFYGSMIELFSKIDRNPDSVLVTNFPRGSRNICNKTIEARLHDTGHRNTKKARNTFVFPDNVLKNGFPSVKALGQFYLWLAYNGYSQVDNSEVFLLGNCTEDCVQATLSALVTGRGVETSSYQKVIDYGAPIVRSQRVHIIRELTMPRLDEARIYENRRAWYLRDTTPLNYVYFLMHENSATTAKNT